MNVKVPNGTLPMQELSRTVCRTNPNNNNRSKVFDAQGTPQRRRITSGANENAQGRAIQNCAICRVMPSEVILLDCGHLCICSECVSDYKRSTKNCPVCRLPVKSTHRAYY